MTPRKIQIIAVPPGEAPVTVREAWVGVEIPLPPWPRNKRMHYLGVGVLSGPKNILGKVLGLLKGNYIKSEGYAVDAIVAVEALSHKNPEAAQWWRVNTPHLMKKGKRLVFPTEVCEEVK